MLVINTYFNSKNVDFSSYLDFIPHQSRDESQGKRVQVVGILPNMPKLIHVDILREAYKNAFYHK